MAMAMSPTPPSSACNQTTVFFCLAPVLNVPFRRELCGSLKVVVSLHAKEDGSTKPAPHLPFTATASIVAATTLFWASPVFASINRESSVALLQIRIVFVHILRAMKSASNLVGLLSDKLFLAFGVGVRVLIPFFKSIVSLVFQVSKCVATGLILPAEKFLHSVGVDTRPVIEALKMAFLAVKQAFNQIFEAFEPVFSSMLHTILAADSLYVLRAVGIVAMIYFLVPIVIQAVAFAVRGYKGELSALQAFDMVLKRGYLLIDVRTEKEKFKSGIPSLPQYATNSILSVPIEDLALKFKGQLRDYRKAEAEVAAIKISFLRRIKKSSQLVILDRYGDVAKLVAKSLTRFGFRKTWVVTDGFDGGKGWVQSRLNTSTRGGIAQMLSPTRLISEGAKKIFPNVRDIDLTPQARQPFIEGDDD